MQNLEINTIYNYYCCFVIIIEDQELLELIKVNIFVSGCFICIDVYVSVVIYNLMALCHFPQ